MFHHGIAGSQVLYNGGFPTQKNLITEQARQILNENELGTLDYYLEEYSQGYITVSAFALALFDLLNTPAKVCFGFSCVLVLDAFPLFRAITPLSYKFIDGLIRGNFVVSHHASLHTILSSFRNHVIPSVQQGPDS